MEDNWETVKKRKRMKKVSHFNKRIRSNIPTAEELNELIAAKSTFHSNFFKMQVDELMNLLKERMNLKDNLISLIQTLKSFIQDIPFGSSINIDDFKLEGVEIPTFKFPDNKKGSFTFVPPERITEVGSYVLETMCSSSTVIDIAIEIPKACWHGNDFLNYKYTKKRAFYLASIANSLLEADFVEDMNFKYQNDCYLKPVLLVTPKGFENIKVSLTAYPCAEAFKQSRFTPMKNNIRTSWFFGKGEDTDEPTSYYNASVLSDLLTIELNDFLKESISSQSIKEAIILLKLWCLKRGLTMGYGRLNGFILTMFVAYLLKKRKINPLMSAYQIFRCTLLAFQNEDFVETGISFCEGQDDILVFERLRLLYDVIFMDASGFLNFCYFVSKETFLMVQHEAKLGILILDNESPTNFSDLFITKITFNRKFEYILHFQGEKKFKKFANKLQLNNQMLNFGENVIAPVIRKICDIFKEGLNKRVSLIDVTKESFTPWPVSETAPNPNIGQVTIGILLNPDVPISNIEKGPVADDPNAQDFRKFWGERSELRRFQDGTIREAVYWPAVTCADRRRVFSKMISDILARHLKSDPNHFAIHGTEMDCILQVPEDIYLDFPPYGTGEEAHTTLMESFNSLSKQLRNLKNLPLLIASIQGTSPSFRFSEVFPPLAALHKVNAKHSYIDGHIMKLKENSVGVPPYVPALRVIVNLEGSGKWPDDIEAIKRVKSAFHLKIYELIKSQLSLMAVAFTSHVDVFKDGFVFRVELACRKEIYLMKQVQMPNGTVKIQESKESRDLEVSTEILPKFNSIFHGLHQQHNTFGTACRLAKRWIAAQLYHSYIHDIAVELLVASIYIHPEPYTVPSSPQIAFIRFLSLFLAHDWTMMPLVVNLNNELQKEEIELIHSSFTSQRSTLPPMVIVTPLDKRGCMWTKNMPAAHILNRLIIYAKASLKSIDEALNNTKIPDIKVIFRPPLNIYDTLIYLNRNEIPRLSCAVDVYLTDDLPRYKPYKQEMNEVYPIVEYNPVEKYLAELRENFGEFAFFLYDIYGGDFIAVKWKKAAFTSKNFTVSHVNCRTLNGDGNQIIPNIEGILEDFNILGNGLVKKIVNQVENWQIP